MTHTYKQTNDEEKKNVEALSGMKGSREKELPKLDFVIFNGYLNSRSISPKMSYFHLKTLDFACLSAVYTESVYCMCSIY